MQIFISYSRRDQAAATKLCDKLRNEGYDVWIDLEGIEAATLWSGEIVQNLKNCDVFLLLLSASSVASHNVIKEVAIASERKKTILPVELHRVELPDALEYSLAGIQRIALEDVDGVLRALSKLAGEKITPPSHSVAPKRKAGAPANKRPAIIGAAVIAVLVAAFFFFGKKDKLVAHGSDRSLVVIPLKTLDDDEEDDIYSQGFSREVIHTLSRLQGLTVVGVNVASDYRDTKLQPDQVASELEVRYVLHGSLQHIDDRISLKLTLRDAEEQENIWSESYKGGVDDLLDMESKVETAIASVLKLQANTAERANEDSPEVYRLLIKADAYAARGSKQDMEEALELYGIAVGIDPKSALAHARLARELAAYYNEYDRAPSLLDSAMREGMRSVMLNGKLAEGYTALCSVYQYQGRHAESVQAGEKALALDQKNPVVLASLAGLYEFSDTQRAAEYYERAVAIENDHPDFQARLALVYDHLRDTARAAATAQKSIKPFERYLRLNPDDLHARLDYAEMLAIVGRSAEAVKIADELVSRSTTDPFIFYNAASIHARAGNAERAIDLVRKTFETGPSYDKAAASDPELDRLRKDPRFIKLLASRSGK